MAATPRRFNTVGEIARRANANVHQVEYLVRARGIRARGKAGNARIFGEQDAARIVAALRKTDAGHAAGAGR
jgi:hypothetical protein